MKLGFIILAHNQPDTVRRLVDILAGAGHRVVIHYDKKAAVDQQQSVRSLEQAHAGLVRVVSQVHCVWGEWSLVEAVLVALREFARMPEKPDYIHLMSGADFPIRPISDLEEFLRRNSDKDFIECCDITQRRWVKGGLSMERFQFFFPVNFRTSRKTFDRLVRWHRKLHIRRTIPLGMTPHMGSQWWTLRWSTCETILDFLKKNPRVVRYFRSTWIPDESFFQTVLAHLIPRREIADLQLIFHHLTPTGRPYTIHPDHLPHVRKLPHFFVRKVSQDSLDGIETIVRTRTSPIPRPGHLARTRDLVRRKINHNFEFSCVVPGHLHGPPPLWKPAPVLVFLSESQSQTELIRGHAQAHPGIVWGGLPFMPEAVALSECMLAATGLTRGATQIRDAFPEQFVDTLAAAMSENKATVLVVRRRDLAAAPALLSRIPGIQFALMGSHALFPSLPIHLVHHLPERRIRRCLDEIAPEGACAEMPWLQSHHFGRIGNYFHLDASIHCAGVETKDIAFILPDIEAPVRPESFFVRSEPSGGIRALMFFWVDDGVFAPVSPKHPAHIMIDKEAARLVPQALTSICQSTMQEVIRMLDGLGDPAIWADRVVLETAASAPLSERLDFLLRAKPHWLPESVEQNNAKLFPGDVPSFPGFDDSDEVGTERDIESIRKVFLQDAAEACALAQKVLLSHELPRREILRTVHPCLPRNSKWWVLALDDAPSLGDEQVADALNSMGTSAFHQGQAALAELCFTAALLIHPISQSSSWNLGLLLASQGRNKEAALRFQSIRRHYSGESISTCWPTRDHCAWPAFPWPTDGFALPDGVASWPRISIVTPSYNQAQYIEETILSVLNQNYPNLQYIVVDGNSTDDTCDVLERYRDRIDHLLVEPDGGQTEAINKGFRLADGDIVAWLNSDDMYAPGTLYQVALHWLRNRADVLAGICAEHRDHRFAVINKPAATNRDFNTAQLARIFPYWFSGTYFFQPEVFFTKALLDRVGLLDESLYYAMDYDLWMRFANSGARLEVIDWPFAFFRLHDAQKTTQSIACITEQCAVRNRHHPIELREERRHQIERQIAALCASENPAIAIFGPHFEAETIQAVAADHSLVRASSVDDPAFASADAALVLVGSQRQEISLLKQIRTVHPDLLLIGCFLNHIQDPHANYEAALHFDIILPTDSVTGDYLRHDSALMDTDISKDGLPYLHFPVFKRADFGME